MPLATYLRTHFREKQEFALMAGISSERLDDLISLHAVPSATYTCNGTSIHSAVFGETPINEALQGEFFRPECARWVKLAGAAPPGGERAAVLAQLEEELGSALSHHVDASEDVQRRVQGYLPFFFDGTFGLCVSDPSTGFGIVRKEMLQETLVRVTANGSDPRAADYPPEALLALIDAYADSAMPFSPAEYARSSRKRLVDDLHAKVADC